MSAQVSVREIAPHTFEVTDAETGKFIRVFKMHPAYTRDPSYHEGYNDALDGFDYEVMLLGGTTVEAEEYRAGYLQGCAEIAHEGILQWMRRWASVAPVEVHEEGEELT
jgi:hypothetical protein